MVPVAVTDGRKGPPFPARIGFAAVAMSYPSFNANLLAGVPDSAEPVRHVPDDERRLGQSVTAKRKRERRDSERDEEGRGKRREVPCVDRKDV